jgi:predicted cupin superfamily sugar epimerase
MLAHGGTSAWHRVDATELWLWHSGAPLELSLADDLASPRVIRLGPSDQFQGLVPAFTWQSARSTGDWTLVSCVVAPAFSFDGFELAKPEALPLDPARGKRPQTRST